MLSIWLTDLSVVFHSPCNVTFHGIAIYHVQLRILCIVMLCLFFSDFISFYYFHFTFHSNSVIVSIQTLVICSLMRVLPQLLRKQVIFTFGFLVKYSRFLHTSWKIPQITSNLV